MDHLPYFFKIVRVNRSGKFRLRLYIVEQDGADCFERLCRGYFSTPCFFPAVGAAHINSV